MVKLVGVGEVKMTIRKSQFCLLAKRKIIFAIAPPYVHFIKKLRSVRSFAMVDLGGVGEVSERFEHFSFNIGFNGDLLRGVAYGGSRGVT